MAISSLELDGTGTCFVYHRTTVNQIASLQVCMHVEYVVYDSYAFVHAKRVL